MALLRNCKVFRIDSTMSNAEVAKELGVECNFDSNRIFEFEGAQIGGRLNPDMIAISTARPEICDKALDIGRELGERSEVNIS